MRRAAPASSETLWLVALLVALGAGWGLTQPLGKIAVSEGYRHFGLVFWQSVISGAALTAVVAARRRRLTLGRPQLVFCAVIALTGTVLPNATSYQAMVYLPSGIVSILLSMVPIFAFPIALAMGTDSFRWRRLAGLACGAAGVAILVAPDASLPERAMIAFIPLALVAPAFYAFEGNVVAKYGTFGLDPIEVLCVASWMSAAAALPLAAATGQVIDPRPPWGAPDAALAATATIHAVVYSSYVWMVGRAGAVFAAQVSYLVTGFGVIWAMLILGESYSGWVWAALAAMFAGLALVQPRPRLDPLGADATLPSRR